MLNNNISKDSHKDFDDTLEAEVDDEDPEAGGDALEEFEWFFVVACGRSPAGFDSEIILVGVGLSDTCVSSI